MKTIEFAIKMELEGQKYYLEQAEKNKENTLCEVFKRLAEEEKMHANILKKKFDSEEYELNHSTIVEDTRNVFSNLKKDFLSNEELPKQINVYREALEIEKKSIELYSKMLEESSDENDKKLFEFLIKEENKHQFLFDDIIAMLLKTDEWVEAAEFGIRKDY
ncbi:MAG TPA: ferritin family protein [Clostridiales bacterium]|nr:ferritin family protein [Clostridiales bacterium]